MLNLLIAEASVGADATRLGAGEACSYALHQGGGVHSCATRVGVEHLPGMGHRCSSFPSFPLSQCSCRSLVIEGARDELPASHVRTKSGNLLPSLRLKLATRTVPVALVVGLGRRSSCKVML